MRNDLQHRVSASATVSQQLLSQCSSFLASTLDRNKLPIVALAFPTTLSVIVLSYCM